LVYIKLWEAGQISNPEEHAWTLLSLVWTGHVRTSRDTLVYTSTRPKRLPVA